MKPSVTILRETLSKLADIGRAGYNVHPLYFDCILALNKYSEEPTGENLDELLQFMKGMHEIRSAIE
jgi:hypothetical protein